jgi:hypothetical protein
MTALGADRQTVLSKPDLITRPMAASVTIYAMSMVSQDSSGNARPARANTTDKVIGINYGDKVANGAVAGAKSVTVRRDVAGWFTNSGSTDAIAITDIGRDCYAVDDQTVALTDGGGARPRAGKIVDFATASGVLVDFSPESARLVSVELQIADVSTADTEYAVAPVAGKIVKITAVTKAAVTVADSVVTVALQPAAGGGFTDVTGGVITVATVGSAIGKSYQVSPTAANTVAPGDTIRVTTDGGSTTTSLLRVTVLIAAA